MTYQLIKIILMVSLLMHGALANAADEKAKPAKTMVSKIVKIVNPTNKVGIQIGDVLKRKVFITVLSDKKITPKSIPLKNTRTEGVELVDVKVSNAEKDNSNQFLIELTYQVFSKASQPLAMALPKEAIRILDTENLVLPAWRFWYSPLVDTTLDQAVKHVQPQDKSPLLETKSHWQKLLAYGALLLAGLLGLFYINADANWLPWMGGNFAKAHKKIKRLHKDEANAAQSEQALAALHAAFNQTYGRNLFENEVDTFVSEHKAFGKVTSDIKAFFKQSNQALFVGDSKTENAALMQQLLSLSKQLRDVERGV
jgi:mxaA protein